MQLSPWYLLSMYKNMNSKSHACMGWMDSPNILSSQVRIGLETARSFEAIYTHDTWRLNQYYILCVCAHLCTCVYVFELCANVVVMNKMSLFQSISELVDIFCHHKFFQKRILNIIVVTQGIFDTVGLGSGGPFYRITAWTT